MLKFVRKTENDIARLAAEQNRQIQNLVSFTDFSTVFSPVFFFNEVNYFK